MPIRELVEKLEPPPLADTLEAGRDLQYRDFLTVALISRKLSILRTGKVLGGITYSALSIESGGLLDGTLSRGKAEDTAILPFYKEGDQSQ